MAEEAVRAQHDVRRRHRWPRHGASTRPRAPRRARRACGRRSASAQGRSARGGRGPAAPACRCWRSLCAPRARRGSGRPSVSNSSRTCGCGTPCTARRLGRDLAQELGVFRHHTALQAQPALAPQQVVLQVNLQVVEAEHAHVAREAFDAHGGPGLGDHEVEQVMRVVEHALGLERRQGAELARDGRAAGARSRSSAARRSARSRRERRGRARSA